MMLKYLPNDIALFLVNKHIIEAEKTEKIEYGIQVILLNFSVVFITFIITVITKSWWNYLVFMFVFAPLRITCGGYHCKTNARCLFSSSLLYLVTIFFVKMVKVPVLCSIAEIILCLLFITLFAPIENENNELDSKDRKKNKLISRILAIIDSIIFVICLLFYNKAAVSIMIFILLECILMIIEMISHQKRKLI